MMPRVVCLVLCALCAGCGGSGPSGATPAPPPAGNASPTGAPQLLIDNTTGAPLTLALDGRAISLPPWAIEWRTIDAGPHELSGGGWSRRFDARAGHCYLADPGRRGHYRSWKEVYVRSLIPTTGSYDRESRDLSGADWHELARPIAFPPGHLIPSTIAMHGEQAHRYCLRLALPAELSREHAETWLAPERYAQLPAVYSGSAEALAVVEAGLRFGLPLAERHLLDGLAPTASATDRPRFEHLLARTATPERRAWLHHYLASRLDQKPGPEEELIVALARIGGAEDAAALVARLPEAAGRETLLKASTLDYAAARPLALSALPGPHGRTASLLLMRPELAEDAPALEALLSHPSAVEPYRLIDALLRRQGHHAALDDPIRAAQIARAVLALEPAAVRSRAELLATPTQAAWWAALAEALPTLDAERQHAVLTATMFRRSDEQLARIRPLLLAAGRVAEGKALELVIGVLIRDDAVLDDPAIRARLLAASSSGELVPQRHGLLSRLADRAVASNSPDRPAQLVAICLACGPVEAPALKVLKAIGELDPIDRSPALATLRQRAGELPKVAVKMLCGLLASGAARDAAHHPSWLALLQGEPPAVRLAAFRELVAYADRYPALVEPLQRAAQTDPDETARTSMDEALAPLLKRQAKAQDREAERARLEAVRAVALALTRGDTSARATLHEIVRTRSDSEALEAARALTRRPDASDLDPMRERLTTASPDLKRIAVSIARAQGAHPVALAIYRATGSDPDALVRRTTYDALAALATRLPELQRLLAELLRSEPDAKLAAAYQRYLEK